MNPAKDTAPVPTGRSLTSKLFWTLVLAPFLWPLGVLLTHLQWAAATPPEAVAPPAPPGADEAPLIRHETIFQPVPEFARFHAATLAQAPNGDLLAACRGDRPGASRSSWGMSAAILLSRKSPGAAQWSAPVAISATPDRMDTNPVLWCDPVFGGPSGKGGRIWLFHGTSYGIGWQFSRISYRYSDDCGQSWSERKPINGIENLNTRCPPVSVPLPGGGRQIVLPVYREFGQSLCLISSDNGATWQPSDPIVSGIVGNFQPSLILNPDNSIDAYLRASGMQHVLFAHSANGGWGWSPAQPLELNNPFTSVAAARLEPANERYIVPAETVLVFNNTEQAERFHLAVGLQRSGSPTPWFSAPREIAPAEARDVQQEYPCALATADGHFLIAYTLGRSRINLAECNPAWILQPGGALTGGPAAPGWRGLPALVALLLFLAGMGLARWLAGGWVRAAGGQSWAQVAGSFQALVLAVEGLLLVLIIGLGPLSGNPLQYPTVLSDNFISVLAAVIVTAWVACGGLLVFGLVRAKGRGLAVLAGILGLAGPLAFGTVVAGHLIWPPQDPGFGAVAVARTGPALTPGEPGTAQRLAELRRDYQLEYRARERVALEAGPGEPPEKILERFETLREQLDATFAASRGVTREQLAALSPYSTGEQFVRAPSLQTNAPLFIRATGWSAPLWLVGLVLGLLARRRQLPAPPGPEPAP